MDNMNTTYQDIITSFVLNKVLHHVGILLIIGNNNICNIICTNIIKIGLQVVPGITHIFVKIRWKRV